MVFCPVLTRFVVTSVLDFCVCGVMFFFRHLFGQALIAFLVWSVDQFWLLFSSILLIVRNKNNCEQNAAFVEDDFLVGLVQMQIQASGSFGARS